MLPMGTCNRRDGTKRARGGVLHKGPIGTRKRGGMGLRERAEERSETGSCTTSGPGQGRAAHSDVEKEQGEPSEDDEMNTAAGAPGDTDPGTETCWT